MPLIEQLPFNEAANPAFMLTQAERDMIDRDLDRYLGMEHDDRDALIRDIEKTGGFRIFGYGSLIGDPSSESDLEFGGEAKGWEKGAFSKDRHYRGTPEKLAVTMGALPTEDGEGALPGLVRVIEPSEGEDRSFAERVQESIRAFAKRETSLNPIYEYELVDIETKNHGTVKALICASDPENPLYLGRDGEEGGLTLDEKAAIIATSIGVPEASSRNTGMSYWRDHVHVTKMAGFEPDPKIEELVQQAELYRAQLEVDDPELFATLTELEAKTAPANAPEGLTYANPVYDVDVVSASDNPKRVTDVRDQAIERAELLNDPLSADQVSHIENLMSELEAPSP